MCEMNKLKFIACYHIVSGVQFLFTIYMLICSVHPPVKGVNTERCERELVKRNYQRVKANPF